MTNRTFKQHCPLMSYVEWNCSWMSWKNPALARDHAAWTVSERKGILIMLLSMFSMAGLARYKTLRLEAGINGKQPKSSPRFTFLTIKFLFGRGGVVLLLLFSSLPGSLCMKSTLRPWMCLNGWWDSHQLPGCYQCSLLRPLCFSLPGSCGRSCLFGQLSSVAVGLVSAVTHHPNTETYIYVSLNDWKLLNSVFFYCLNHQCVYVW